MDKRRFYLDGYLCKQANPAAAAALAPAATSAAGSAGATAGSTLLGVAGKGAGALFDLSNKALTKVWDIAWPLLLLAPAVAGAAGGALHAKLTSPTEMDLKSVQDALELTERQEFLAELRRRKAMAEAENAEGDDRERSLHI